MRPTLLRRFLPLILPLFVLLLSIANGFGQEAAAPGGGEEAHSILDTILKGGALIIMIWLAILATSVTMVTLIVQNVITLRPAKIAPPPLIEAIRQNLEVGNYQEAWEVCNANRNYLANVVKAGLTRIGRGKDAVGDALAEHGLREATITRTRNSYLSVIGVIAPMIGLLGTVIGMMNAFAVLGSTGISNPRALASSIGEVLLATASGLFIAIPAFIAYYIFRNRSQMCIVHGDDVVNTLMTDIPYEELQGVQIGESFSAGAPVPISAGGARKVSMALTTNCPICNGPVTPGVNPCPHCGSTLDWAG